MNQNDKIRIVFVTISVLSILFSGCSTAAQSSDAVESKVITVSTGKTADYSISRFKISQGSTETGSEDTVSDLLNVKDPDRNEISFETDKDEIEVFYENQKYSITISYEIKADQKKKTSSITFTVNVIDKVTIPSADIPSNTTVTYLYDGLPENEDEAVSTPSASKSSSTKTASSSKANTSQASSNTGNSSAVSQSSPADQSSNNTIQSSGTSQVEQPAHVHEWKEHHTSSTRTVQTGTIHHYAVTVEHPGYWWCGCGATFSTEAEVLAHQEAEIDQGQAFNYGYKSGYTEVIQNAYDEPVYSEETYDYVDYYYCSCGATK